MASPTTAATVDDRPKTPSNSRPGEKPSSPIKDVWPTMDVHKRDEWSRLSYPLVNTEITRSAMRQKLCPTYETGGGLAPPPPTMTKTPDKGPSTYCKYLNQLSAEFRNKNTPYTIQFRVKESTSPLLHATGTICRPDIVAVRNYGASANRLHLDHIHWSHLEATGEEDSGKPKKEGEAQAGAYTAYHLQARPDLVSVVGIFVAVSNFQLFFSNASRVYHTPATEWTHPDARKLLYALIWRLYNPERDPSIDIDMKSSEAPTFTVTTTDKNKYTSLNILRAGESVGRRTIILANCEPQPKPEPAPVLLLKNNTLKIFREGTVLKKIHGDRRFPGVVRLGHSEQVMDDGRPVFVEYQTKKKKQKAVTTVTRSKTRLVLKDKGTRLADVKTPRKFLKGIYDLLEISRIMYRECKILHRDISPENVLVVDQPTFSTEPLRDDLGDICFSQYLLNKSAAQGGSKSGDRWSRLATKVVLIDFDVSEDQDPGNPSLGDPMARTGTPIFMAWMVRSNSYPAGLYDLPPMPDVVPELLEHYRRTLGTRLEDFPANTEEVLRVPKGATLASNKFRHLLRYDAETVFWYLLWWCIQAQPAKNSPEETIRPGDWATLTREPDRRDLNWIKTFLEGCLHSSYAGLFTLLDDMRMHLSGDLEFSKHKERKENPEYMHEVFQRLILNFLVVNENKKFMDREKSDKPRRVEPGGMDRTRTTQTSKRPLEDPANNPRLRKKPKKK